MILAELSLDLYKRNMEAYREFYTRRNIDTFFEVSMIIEKSHGLINHPLYDRNVLGDILQYSLYDSRSHTFKNAALKGKVSVFRFLLGWKKIPRGDVLVLVKQAITKDSVQILQMLLEGKMRGRSPTFEIAACISDSLQCLKYLLSFSVSDANMLGVNLEKNMGFCIRNDAVKCFTHLVSKNIDEVNLPRILKYVIQEGAIKVFDYMLQVYEENARDVQSMISLKELCEHAIFWGKKNIVETLLGRGVKVQDIIEYTKVYGEEDLYQELVLRCATTQEELNLTL